MPFMLHVLVQLVEGFHARYPDVELELNSNEGIIDLIERRTDVAFRIGALKDPTLHARRPHPHPGQPGPPAAPRHTDPP